MLLHREKDGDRYVGRRGRGRDMERGGERGKMQKTSISTKGLQAKVKHESQTLYFEKNSGKVRQLKFGDESTNR